MNRAGWAKRRMHRYQRRNATLTTVRELCAKSVINRCTMRQVAKRMGLQPSTYVLNILNDLNMQGSINRQPYTNSRGNTVYHWWPAIEGEIPF